MTTLEYVRDLAAALDIHEVGACRWDEAARPVLACRAASRLPKAARSVIVCLFPYAFESEAPRNLSRYACVPDYHTAAGAVLRAFAQSLREAFPAESFEAFLDNSPVREVAAAVAADLGVRGDNGLFISDAFGSYVFIGCVVTTLALPVTEAARECVHCGACAAACPGACLPSALRDTCVSSLTQQKCDWTEEERALVLRGGSLWGCDMCQEVCPMNADKPKAPHPCFTWYDPQMTVRSLEDISEKAYGWRGKAVLERNLALFNEKE